VAPAADPTDVLATALSEWFTSLARNDPRDGMQPRAGNASLSFDLAGEGQVAAAEVAAQEFGAWLERLRPAHARVEYRIAELAVGEGVGGRHRVRFALERRSVDEVGLDHIALSDETWQILVLPDGSAVVDSIATRPLLAFPGTGPQIVCY
jgi:hypothetical protein